MESVSWSTIGVAGGLIALSLTFAGFWMKIAGQMSDGKAKADAAMEEAKSAGLRAVQANLKIDALQTELSSFQRYAEKEFANHDDLRQLASHNDAQFSGMKEDLRGITQRLDKLLERGFPPIGA